MATSGTVASTQVTVDDLIAQAVTRAGKLKSTVGGELLADIRLALYFLIADLGNDGVNLWCLKKTVVDVAANKIAYQLPLATNSVTNALYRTLNAPNGTYAVAADSVTFTSNSPIAVNNITFTFAADGFTSPVVEYFDGTAWRGAASIIGTYVVNGANFVMDLDSTALASMWRVRDTTGTLLALTNVLFRTIALEITMAPLNRDDYTNLPNKYTPGLKALQFWFDKQINPRIFVWPMSTSLADQIVFWTASEVEDPGELQNSLAVPTRWYQAIVDALAYRTAMLIPPNELVPGRLDTLKMDAADSKKRANDGESDGSSFRIAPRIGGYTK
jgi:hypothetical protein